MRTCTCLAAVMAAGLGLAAAGLAGAQQRQAEAHEHGRGTLNIAIEGSRLTMELEVPSADIVGFEHRAKTEKQKAAIAAAKRQLAAPQALFKLTAAAGCVLEEARVELEGEDHDRDAKGHGDKDHAQKGDKHADAKADHDDAHAGFKAAYAFDCKSPGSLAGIGFDYFKVFAGADKLSVTVITLKGQSQFEVSRAKPRIDLGGMM